MRPRAPALAKALKPRTCQTLGHPAGLSDQGVGLKPQDGRMGGQARGTGGRELAGSAAHGQAGSRAPAGAASTSAFVATVDVV